MAAADDRMKLFWLVHGRDAMESAMRSFNDIRTQCGCCACAVAGRYDDRGADFPAPSDGSCRFLPAFNAVLAQQGFSVTPFHDGINNARQAVHSHFVNPARGDWVSWGYGSLLLDATSAEDPELARYVELLRALGDDGEGDDNEEPASSSNPLDAAVNAAVYRARGLSGSHASHAGRAGEDVRNP